MDIEVIYFRDILVKDFVSNSNLSKIFQNIVTEVLPNSGGP
jgi:hypothetical protein